ncbi:MAG: hypothetical protein K0R05_3852 [Anaerocolumna sp.]|jgi:hypothetical protein|nr:hypothetical protein [Anaerocolumna sp.]
MKNIKICARCGVKEKRGKVLEAVSNFHLCIDCAQIAYKARDAALAGDPDKANEQIEEFIKGVKDSSAKEPVLIWVDEYKKRIFKK